MAHPPVLISVHRVHFEEPRFAKWAVRVELSLCPLHRLCEPQSLTQSFTACIARALVVPVGPAEYQFAAILRARTVTAF
jgi:hypothetical protein